MSNFISENVENGDYNQYWYSKYTIDKMVEEINHLNGRVAFLSTPSLYFTVNEIVREKSFVFDVSPTRLTRSYVILIILLLHFFSLTRSGLVIEALSSMILIILIYQVI